MRAGHPAVGSGWKPDRRVTPVAPLPAGPRSLRRPPRRSPDAGLMQAIASANPVNWAPSAARGALTGHPDWTATLVHGGFLVALAVATVLLSTLTFRAYQRSV